MANRIVDGGFEQWTSATDATQWTESIAGSSTVNRDTAGKRSGMYCLRLDIDSSNNDANVVQAFRMVRGRKYRLVVWYKNSAAGKTAAVVIRDSTSTTYLQDDLTWGAGVNTFVLPNSTSYRSYVIEFTSNTGYSIYHILLGIDSAASSSIYYDEVGLYPMNVCGFAWDNKWDAGTLTASSSAVYFPANNTRHRWHRKTWRTSSLGAPDYMILDAGANVSVGAGFLRYTNFQSNATVLVQANTANNWAAPAQNFSLASNTNIVPYIWANATSYRYWRWAITDATNPSNYVEVGRIYLGPVFEPMRSFVYGGGMGAKTDPSVLSESDDGQASAILKTHYKSGSLTFERISSMDKGMFENLYTNVGAAKPFFFIQDMGDPWSDCYYVYISGWEIIPEYDNRYTVRMTLREAR